jgi:hypothetical protein
LATFHAAAAIGETITRLLEGAAVHVGDALPRTTFAFVRELSAPAMPAVTVYLHRVIVSTARNNFQGRTGPRGAQLRRPLPLDFSYLITAWGRDAKEQAALLVWAMRQLEDLTTLPAAVLNQSYGTTTAPFQEDESVQVVFEALSIQDQVNVWHVAEKNMQPSASYIARTIPIDTLETESEVGLVQTRVTSFTPKVPT